MEVLIIVSFDALCWLLKLMLSYVSMAFGQGNGMHVLTCQVGLSK
jgi:hypothetical protein